MPALALASSLAGPALAQSGGMDHANMPGMNHGTATPAPRHPVQWTIPACPA